MRGRLSLSLSNQQRDQIAGISTKQSPTAAGPRCRSSWEGVSTVPTMDHALGCTSITPQAQFPGGTPSPELPGAKTCLRGLRGGTAVCCLSPAAAATPCTSPARRTSPSHAASPGPCVPPGSRTAATPDLAVPGAVQILNTSPSPKGQQCAASCSKSGDEHCQVAASAGTHIWQESCRRISRSRPSPGSTMAEPRSGNVCPLPARPKPAPSQGSCSQPRCVMNFRVAAAPSLLGGSGGPARARQKLD